MNGEIFSALRAAVTLAKVEQIRQVAALRLRLQQNGFSSEAIEAALRYWAEHEGKKRA